MDRSDDDSPGHASPVDQLIGAAAALAALLTMVGADPLAGTVDLPFGRLLPCVHAALVAAALLALGWSLRTSALVRELRGEVSRLTASEAGAHGAARVDALTGLPNRRALKDSIDKALDGLWPGLGVVVLLIDLDGFKTINDIYGHDAGDVLLCQVAARLRGVLSFGVCVARLGGDEFAALIPYSLRHRADVEAHAVVAALAESFPLGDVLVSLGASVGVARAPEDASDTQALLRAADIAMYNAKQSGRGRWQSFDLSMDTELRETAALKSELRQAIAEQQVVPFYQPIVDLRQGGRIVEFEVLARWRHPRLGLLTPDRFIHLVEPVGQSTPLLVSLLQQVARDAAAWPASLRFAVNVFPSQLLDPHLIDTMAAAIHGCGLLPSRICIEVTESSLVQDGARARLVIDAARRLGMTVALDDFGTGYSSLYHLLELRLDRLKIDRSFVQAMAKDERNSVYVGAILALAEALTLEVIAEGIETAETARTVADMGCAFGQGYLYAEPTPAAGVAALLKDHCSSTGPARRRSELIDASGASR